VAADGEPYFRLSGQAAAQRLDAVAMGRLPALLNAVKRLQEMLEAAIEMCGKAPNRPALLTIKYALAASMSALDQPMDSSPRDSNEITEELVDIWKREYPTQNPDFPRAYVWEEREVPLAQLGGKASVKKARVAEYETLLANGQDLRPLVALDHGIGQLNLLDGYHRRAALTKAKRETATVYVGRLRGAVAN
jgi:hypothetical protein